MPISNKFLNSLIILNLVIGLILIHVLSVKLITLIELHLIPGFGLITFAELMGALVTLSLVALLYKSSFFRNMHLKLEFENTQSKSVLISIGLYIGFYIATLLLAQFVYIWFVDLDQINNEYQNHFLNDSSHFTSPFGNIQLIIGILLIAPILEEIIFRGLLWSSLRKYWNFWLATLISAFIFAVFHISLLWSWQLNLIVVIEIFLLGCCLAWLMEYSRNLVYPIIVHGFNNFLAGLSLILLQ
ncbi:MAG: CPBP family intramembrane metalloprotease [Candidatus Saccharibacteria bacterium]|nr:CPBP family intramembrane metalloprotease [Candidatus Saccharibacteria bacterium]